MKKFLIYGVAIAAIIWSLGLAVGVPVVSAAYSPIYGDLVKTPTNTAVYLIGNDYKRHLYSNQATFWTWYTGSWSNIKSGSTIKTVKIISQEDFDSLSSGNNVTVRPNSTLLQFQNSSRMYTATADGQLAAVPDSATAQRLFGSDWNKKIITIQDSFESNYAKDGALN